jgi:hypothetical protein
MSNDKTAILEREVSRLKNKLNSDSQNFEIECLKATIASRDEVIRDLANGLDGLIGAEALRKTLKAKIGEAEAERKSLDRSDEASIKLDCLLRGRTQAFEEVEKILDYSEQVRAFYELADKATGRILGAKL